MSDLDPEHSIGEQAAFPTIEGYEISAKIGEDDIGIAYKARETARDREVLLVKIHSWHTATADSSERWRSALRAATRLNYHYIFPVWEIGAANGDLFYTTPVVAMTTLSNNAVRFRRNFKIGAKLVAEIADTIHYAHQNGVLHRHLDSDKVFIDGTKLLYVSRFGLPFAELSSTESARVSTDLYQIGVILYHLLTDRHPFPGVPAAELAQARRTSHPPSPRDFDKAIPKDLEEICLRCLAFDPDKCYKTADALAEDLRNWLAKRPVSTNEFSLVASFRKWTSLNPYKAWLAWTIAILLVGIAVCSSVGLYLILSQKKLVEISAANLREEVWQGSLAHLQTAENSRSAGRITSALAAIRTAAKIRVTPELRSAAVSILASSDLSITNKWTTRPISTPFPLLFSPDLKLTFRSTPAGSFEVCDNDSQNILGKIALRKNDPVTAIAPLMKFGHLMATRSQSGTIRVWESAAPGTIVHEVEGEPVADDQPWKEINFAINPAGLLAIGQSDGRIALHEIILQSSPTYISGGEKITQLAFDPTGNLLAIVRQEASEIEIIDPVQPDAAPVLLKHIAPIVCLCWSVDSQQIAAASADGRVSVWRARDGQPLAQLNTGVFPTQLVFTKFGTHLLTTGLDLTIRLWSLTTGREESRLSGFGLEPVLRLSADDQRLFATDNSGTAVEIAVRLPGLLHELPAMLPRNATASIGALDFSFDNHFLAVATRFSLEVREVATGELLVSETSREPADWSVAFTPFSQSIYLKKRAGELGRCPIIPQENGFRFGLLENLHHFEGSDIAHLNATGKLLSLIDRTKKTSGFFNSENFKTLAGAQISGAEDLVFNPSDSHYVMTSQAANPTVFDMETGRNLHELEVGPGGRADWSPDGKWIIASGTKGCLVWSANDWSPGPSLGLKTGSSTARLAFSPNGNLLAIVVDQWIKLYNGKEFTLLYQLPAPRGAMAGLHLRFSRDSRHLALLNDRGSLQIWHLEEIRQALAAEELDW